MRVPAFTTPLRVRRVDLQNPLADNRTVEISLLRQATEGDHAAVEGSFDLLSAALTRETYVETLHSIEGFVRAWESLAETAAPSEIQPLVRMRNRHALLESDLRALLGYIPTSQLAPIPTLQGSAEFLGALYVMEGSRLGGQYIARHVDDTLRLNGQGTAYFRGFGDKTGSMWKDVLVVLEREISERETDRAIAAAKRMFQSFGSWMRRGASGMETGMPAHFEVSENG